MKMMYRIAIVVFAGLALFAPHAAPAQTGGFGVSPPYIHNTHLIRGVEYERRVLLVRSSASGDAYARIEVRGDEIKEWISMAGEESSVFLPEGERRIPLFITISVPPDVELGRYTGKIDILLSPSRDPEPGTVGIATGAQLDVDFEVIDKKIYSLRFRGADVEDLEEGFRWLWMYFPGKLRFAMHIENTGNMPHAPSRVEMDIYDAGGRALLEQTKNTNSIARIAPFRTETVVAELPVFLGRGSYRVEYRIYDGDTLLDENARRISVLPRGALAGYAGYGMMGLPARDKLIISLILFAALCIVLHYVPGIMRRVEVREEVHTQGRGQDDEV